MMLAVFKHGAQQLTFGGILGIILRTRAFKDPRNGGRNAAMAVGAVLYARSKFRRCWLGPSQVAHRGSSIADVG
jgi:hypothetical protein